MPYIKRQANGSIYSLAQQQDSEHIEFVSPTNAEFVEFLTAHARVEHSKQTLEESDKGIARVTEDLVQLMINKGVILFTDLPPAVQQKLLSREKLRSHLHQENASFLDDGDSI